MSSSKLTKPNQTRRNSRKMSMFQGYLHKKSTVAEDFEFSRDPSYTELNQSLYNASCRKNITRARLMQQRQFFNEITRIERLQEKALDCVRIHRMFVKIIRKPVDPNEIIKHTRSDQFLLDALMGRTYSS